MHLMDTNEQFMTEKTIKNTFIYRTNPSKVSKRPRPNTKKYKKSTRGG